MWRWLFSKKPDFPSYSLLEAEPCRGLPQDLDAQEKSDDFHQRCNRIESELCAQATDESTPGFATFLKEGDGLLQFLSPELKGGCLLAFSSALRAADYARVQVPDKKFSYFCSSPAQAVAGIAQFRERETIRHVALDRCPRCNVFMAVDASRLNSAANLIRVWKIAKSIEIARCNLYLDYARAAAAAGQFLVARDVALELVGHVTAEDPRPHMLLGTLAPRLRDKKLHREARRYLEFLHQDAWVAELGAATRANKGR